MVTTIQLNEDVKKVLDGMKENRETYEEIILKLITTAEVCRRKNRDLLIEGYKEMAEENMKINKEFEAMEEDFDWEW